MTPNSPSFPVFISDLDTLRSRRSLKWRQGSPDSGRIRLTIAEMDIEPPDFLLSVLRKALRAGETGYADPVEQERACQAFMARYHEAMTASVRCTTDVLTGIKVVLADALVPGSSVLLEPPVYGDLYTAVAEAGCMASPVPLQRDPGSGRYYRDWEALERAAALKDARAWIICQPHNPIGQVWDEEDTARALDLAARYDLLLIANEVHLPLGLDGPLKSVFAHPAADRTRLLGLTSASKAFNVPGLKSASLYATARTASFLEALPQSRLGRPGILGTLATVACYEQGGDWLASLRQRLAECVDTTLEQLAMLPVPVTAARPQATYLVWAKVADPVLADFRAALDTSGVALCAGTDYGGPDYESYFRINSASHPDVLTTAFQAIGRELTR